jgi:hypothetical protein
MIMAKRAVEVSECDRCGKEPANTWFITGPDGAPREIELCDQHGSPIANAYALGRPVTQKATRGPQARGRGTRAPESPAAADLPSKAPSRAPTKLPPLPVPAEPEPLWR